MGSIKIDLDYKQWGILLILTALVLFQMFTWYSGHREEQDKAEARHLMMEQYRKTQAEIYMLSNENRKLIQANSDMLKELKAGLLKKQDKKK